VAIADHRVRVAVAVSFAIIALLSAEPLAIAGIHVYQRTVSPVMTRLGIHCRFTTSCSRYAEVVITRDGVLVGGLKTARRLARCGPWTPLGTVDEP
jgi:putative component of membrane protein insertase Oxa1/YidC/SpoIIIJ protein YidD